MENSTHVPALLGPAPAPPAAVALVADLYRAVLSGRKAQTLRAYASDLEDFGRFVQAPSASAGLDILVAFPPGLANATALAYRSHLLARELKSATVARRLSALRTAVKVARQLGRITWELEVESPRTETYRDTSGPGREGWSAVLALAKAGATTPKGRRDLAIIRLLHDVALRRKEVAGLDLVDVDVSRGIIHVLGKGKSERSPITLPPPTRASLADWIATRGEAPGPVFHRLDRPTAEGRLTGESIRKLVGALGRAAGLSRPLRPHGLRHQGITRALDATGGDVRAVRRFSRHSKVETLLVYDDNRRDLAGDVARAVADE